MLSCPWSVLVRLGRRGKQAREAMIDRTETALRGLQRSLHDSNIICSHVRWGFGFVVLMGRTCYCGDSGPLRTVKQQSCKCSHCYYQLHASRWGYACGPSANAWAALASSLSFTARFHSLVPRSSKSRVLFAKAEVERRGMPSRCSWRVSASRGTVSTASRSAFSSLVAKAERAVSLFRGGGVASRRWGAERTYEGFQSFGVLRGAVGGGRHWWVEGREYVT